MRRMRDPQVKAALRVLDAPAGRLEGGLQNRPPLAVPIPLLLHMRVVVECGSHRRLHRRRHHQARVPADLQQPAHHCRVPCDESGPVAGHVGPFRQRVHGQDAIGAVRKQASRRRSEGEFQVALVGDDKHIACPAPGRKRRKVLGRRDPAVRVGRVVDPKQLGAGANSGERGEVDQAVIGRDSHRLAASDPGAHVVRRVGQIWKEDRPGGAEQGGQQGDKFLTADGGDQFGKGVNADPDPALEPAGSRQPDPIGADSRRIPRGIGGVRKRPAYDLWGRVDRRADRQVDQAAWMLSGHIGVRRKAVPREVGQR